MSEIKKALSLSIAGAILAASPRVSHTDSPRRMRQLTQAKGAVTIGRLVNLNKEQDAWNRKVEEKREAKLAKRVKK